MTSSRWIACQVGFRDHYLVPRVLHDLGVLHRALTELWVRPGTLLHALGGQRLRERYHPDLADGPVKSWNYRGLAKEIVVRASHASLWDGITSRNRWFQRRCIEELRTLRFEPDAKVTVFSYSYAAREIFDFARSRGWRTVLGQMDAGEYDEQLMIELYARHATISRGWERMPSQFWKSWRQECELADRIVVNSFWSQEALTRAGISGEKIRVIPLAYEASADRKGGERNHPARFSAERPLRVLFVGQVTVRKGVAEILEALTLLDGLPIRITFVGPIGIDIPPAFAQDPRIEWAGHQARSRALEYYRDADVFLFPSHSDGFGITQLEAQAQHLPVIASPFCGQVVEHERNGLVLHQVSATAIAEALRRIVNDPALLGRFAATPVDLTKHSKEHYAKALLSLD